MNIEKWLHKKRNLIIKIALSLTIFCFYDCLLDRGHFRVAQEALFFALSIVLFNTTNCNFCINIYWRYGWRKKAYHRKTKEFLVSQPKNSFVFPYLLVILKKRESRYILFLQFLQQHCMSFSLWFWFLSQGFPCLAATLSHSSSSVFSYENYLLE